MKPDCGKTHQRSWVAEDKIKAETVDKVLKGGGQRRAACGMSGHETVQWSFCV